MPSWGQRHRGSVVRAAAAGVAAGVLALLAGCGSDDNFQCTGDSACQRGDEQGVCEPIGFCSFTDDTCDSGRRYDETAGNGFAGVCVGAPDLEIDPASLSFGGIVVNATGARLTARVTNVGQAPISGLVAEIVGANAAEFEIGADNCTDGALGIGESCTIDVVFVPSITGSLAARLEVGDDTSAVMSELSGMSFAPSELAIAPASIDFDPTQILSSSSSPEVLTVTNTGDLATDVLEAVLMGDAAAEFAVVGGCVGEVLGPGESCDLEIVFDADELGDRSASVVVREVTTPSAGQTASLSGIGFATLSVTVSEAGIPTGFVTSDPTGIDDCGTSGIQCSADFTESTVTLTACPVGNPRPSAQWLGSSQLCSSVAAACTGGAACSMELGNSSQETALVKFTSRHQVNILMDDHGTNAGGTVTAPDINCVLPSDNQSSGGTGDCDQLYDVTLGSVTLIATPSDPVKFRFVRWSSVAPSSCGVSSTCVLDLSLATTITLTAEFACVAGQDGQPCLDPI